LGLVLHQVDQPVLVAPTGLDQRVAASRAAQPAVRLTVQDEDDFLILPLLNVDRARVPDRYLTAAVFVLGDSAFKLGVVQRVVLGVDDHALGASAQRRTYGHRPGVQHTGAPQAAAIVQRGSDAPLSP